jgi:hypothetical protein
LEVWREKTKDCFGGMGMPALDWMLHLMDRVDTSNYLDFTSTVGEEKYITEA